MAITRKVTTKGQVMPGKKVPEHPGIRSGDRLATELPLSGRMQAKTKLERSVSTIFGIMKRSGDRVMTIGEIREASAAAWAGEQ
jgi:hypothetical protein